MTWEKISKIADLIEKMNVKYQMSYKRTKKKGKETSLGRLLSIFSPPLHTADFWTSDGEYLQNMTPHIHSYLHKDLWGKIPENKQMHNSGLCIKVKVLQPYFRYTKSYSFIEHLP